MTISRRDFKIATFNTNKLIDIRLQPTVEITAGIRDNYKPCACIQGQIKNDIQLNK